MPSKTICVLDDNLDDLILMETVLIAAGYSVAGFSNGRFLMNQMKLIQPDLVVLDLVMDEVDGIELVSTIYKRFPNTPIIVVSGHEEFLPLMSDLGASACIHKCIGFQHSLKATVSQLMNSVKAA